MHTFALVYMIVSTVLSLLAICIRPLMIGKARKPVTSGDVVALTIFGLAGICAQLVVITILLGAPSA